MQRIFLRRWVCVGRTTDLAEPGAYFLVFLDRESVIVVRDRAGVIRAFYNVCQHRGTRLCNRERGRFSETIQCPYHAWTCDLEGMLIGAPHMDGVAGFDKREHHLRSVPVHAWEEFLFGPHILAWRFAVENAMKISPDELPPMPPILAIPRGTRFATRLS